MNKKRWLAVAIALVIFVISFAVPKYENKIAEDKIDEYLSKYLPKDDGILGEEVLVPGATVNRILRLELNGTITSGGSTNLAGGGYDHNFFLDQLESALNDSSVQGILLVVNTPGGGVYESAQIRKKLLELKENNVPIYVSMANLAASGGYYISADADKIFATPETWTGSIGVISQVMDFSGLMEKYGVKVHSYASGDMKTMGSAYKEPSEKEIAIWNELTKEAYDQFVALVAQGRNMSEEEVRVLADGRIYSGTQAKNNGLVDVLGDEEAALDALIKDNDLGGAEVFQYKKSQNPFASLLGPYMAMKSPKSDLQMLETFIEKQEGSAPRLYYLYGGH